MVPGDVAERIPWRPIEPLDAAATAMNGAVAALEALRAEWLRYLGELAEHERSRIQQRSLRRLAIETGIIERLYDIDWGLTLTLVAEGFARDVVERAGGAIDERTLATLEAQRDALAMVLDFVRTERKLSPGFIKELHSAITRTQATYVATNTLGQVVEAELPHGEWKSIPNHVMRSDGRLLEYAPPEHVASEVDRLVSMHEQHDASGVHPIVLAAWLHHRFVQIHPFADGNGRVARALTLLVLQRHQYAPLVVDRFHRRDYLDALDLANDGDLRPLVRLFVRLESAALAGQLERAEEPPGDRYSRQVAHSLAAQIAALREKRVSQTQQATRIGAIQIAARIRRWFEKERVDLTAVFAQQGLTDVKIFVAAEVPPDSDRNLWYQRQIIETAHVAGHFANFSFFAGWARLRMQVEGVQLDYIASLHGAGRDVGVMAVTTFAELRVKDAPEERADTIATTHDAFRFVHTEKVNDLEKRATELEELLDAGLTVALAALQTRLGGAR